MGLICNLRLDTSFPMRELKYSISESALWNIQSISPIDARNELEVLKDDKSE